MVKIVRRGRKTTNNFLLNIDTRVFVRSRVALVENRVQVNVSRVKCVLKACYSCVMSGANLEEYC